MGENNEVKVLNKKQIIKKSESGNREDILNGPIASTLFKLAWPVMIGNIMQVVYNLTDTFWVGKIGAEAVAAISVGFPLVFLGISLGAGITVAGTTLVAQYMGMGDREMTNKVSGQIFTFVVAISIILAFIGLLFSKTVLQWMGAPANILSSAVAYINILFVGMPFMFMFFIFSSLLRGYGDTKTPMKMMVYSTLLNVVLDPVLIFGIWVFPALGIKGAAYATVFSRALAGVAGIYILFTGKKGIVLTKEFLKPDLAEIKKIVRIGLPAAGEQSIVALGMTFLMSIVSEFGTIVVAAYGIGSRILSAITLPSQGFSIATTTMVGQNLGAAQTARAEKSAWVSTGIVLGALTGLALLLNLFPGVIFSIFNSDPEVIEVGKAFMRIVGFSFGFLGVRFVISGSFRGAGNTVIAMVLGIISLWGLRLPLAQYLAVNLHWGTEGIWWGMFLSNFITAIVAAFWFKRGGWKETVISN